jgi:hypothetical protein
MNAGSARALAWVRAVPLCLLVVACGGGGGSSMPASEVESTSGGAPGTPGTSSSGSMPNPQTIAGKPRVGPIRARAGQVIENVHVSASDGPCIIVEGVDNVTIRDAEIGPCGSDGDPDASGIAILFSGNVSIQRNVIHDVSTAVYVMGSSHPIVMDRNYVYNVRGPLPRGQMIQMNGVSGGSSGSRITCNVSDAKPGVRHGVMHGDTAAGIEDHINFFGSPGLEGDHTEVAYNRLRGGSKVSTSGSGIMMGEGGGGRLNVRHNTIVDVVNAGAGISGGADIRFDSNRIYQHRNAGIYVNVGLYVWGQDGASCDGGHTLTNNRIWTAASSGAMNPFWNDGNCEPVSLSGNVFDDATLTPDIFNEVPAACN